MLTTNKWRPGHPGRSRRTPHKTTRSFEDQKRGSLMKSSIWKALGTALFSAALVATLPGSASAYDDLGRENYYGEAEFQGDGEHLGCLDFAADGWGTRAAMEEWHTG